MLARRGLCRHRSRVKALEARCRITDVDVGRFTPAQQEFLEYHRDEVFLQARRRVG